MKPLQDRANGVAAQLGLWDTVSIIVGIVIGAGIFETVPLILSNVSGAWMGLGVWVLGGLLSLIGALCYAELATTYPREGGDYVYLSRAFGSWLGFLFGWAQLAVILTASIGAMAYVFGDYAVKLWEQPVQSENISSDPSGSGKETKSSVDDPQQKPKETGASVQENPPETESAKKAEEDKRKTAAAFIYAALAVIVLSVLNISGVIFGKSTQNILTAAKVLGLGGILIAGFYWGRPSELTFIKTGGSTSFGQFGFVMILVLFTYGGWNDAAFVAAEIRDPKRNIPRALIIGTCGITVIYLLVNTAYIMALGFEDAADSKAIASDVFKLPLGQYGSRAMCLLVMISALGAVNGLIFTGSRIYYKMGSEQSIFAWLGRWHPRLGAPHWSLLVQGLICLTMIVVVGSDKGRDAVNFILTSINLEAIPWRGHGGFATLLICTAPVFWLFFLLTGLSLFALRDKYPDTKRPFSVPFFPFLPFIFCLTCVYMLYSSTTYAVEQFKVFGLIAWFILILGLPLYFCSRPIGGDDSEPTQETTGDESETT